MKKILLPFLFALLGATNVWAAVGDVFTAPVQVVKDGDTTTVQMRFKVAIDMSDYKTCATYATHDELSDTYSPAINYRTEGMVIIPEIVNGYKVETIDSHSFEGCRFSEVELPNTLRFIYYSAFKDCVLLQEIYVPDNVTEILRNAFCGCCNMTKASISCSTIGEKCFYECSKLQSIEFRGPVGAVWTAAFGACSSLSSLSFPAGLHTIYESAFMSCTNLKSIFLPSSLEKIRSGAFDDCTNLSNVIIASETPPAFWPESECAYLFDDLPSDAVLYVPDRTKYNSAPWTKFSQIKSFQPTVEKTISAYFNSSGNLTYVLSYSETIDPSDILDLVIDGEPQMPEVSSGYLTVSKDVTKIPQEVSFLWRKKNGDVVPYKLHYDVKNLGFKINGKSMTTLDLYNVPGLVSGEANIITDSDGNPILVLDEAKFEWNEGLCNQSCKLTIRVNSNSTINVPEHNAFDLRPSTNNIIEGGATLYIYSGQTAISTDDMTHLTIQNGTKVIASGLHGYYDFGFYENSGAYLEIKEGSVLATYGTNYPFSFARYEPTLGAGIDLRYPAGATLWDGSVFYADGSIVKDDWVVFGPDNQATQELIDSLTSSFIRGDVNLDGTVDIADAVCVLNKMAGQPVAGDANVNGDYDEDGNPVIDIADLVTVLNIMAGQ